MSVPSGNSFVFLRISMFRSTSSREKLRLSGKQNKLFPSGAADIKCIILTHTPYVGSTLVFLPELVVIELDNCLTVAHLGGALHRNRRFASCQ